MIQLQRFKILLSLFCFIPAALAWAGQTVEINDTATPPSVNGNISDWTNPPAIVLDKKEQVVIGQNEWTGPDYTSAKVYLTYDQTNLYI